MTRTLTPYHLLIQTLFALIALAFMLPALAAPAQPFDEAAFRMAQQNGKTILVEVHADWCSACAKQKPILESLGKDQAFEKVVRFSVDFDKPGNALKLFRVASQATLLVFRGDKEVARSTFDTNPDSLRAMLAKGI